MFTVNILKPPTQQKYIFSRISSWFSLDWGFFSTYILYNQKFKIHEKPFSSFDYYRHYIINTILLKFLSNEST